MTRKNIFQLVNENYNIQDEIRRINDLLFEQQYFSNRFFSYSLVGLLDNYLFSDWKYRDTCLTVEEFLDRVDAYIGLEENSVISEKTIINNIEAIENFIKLYIDNSNNLGKNHLISCSNDFKTIFCSLLDTLEKRMGLVKKEVKDVILIYPENAPLERLINILEDENIQWELIRYTRDKMSLSEKKKSLAYLATNLYIENRNETDEQIRILLKKATNILNNLQIRHNNQNDKCINSILDIITEEESINLCDYTFDLMLTIVLLREQKKYVPTYKAFEDKQKQQAKNRENNNG